MFKLNKKEIVVERFPNNETKVKDFEQFIKEDNLLEFNYADIGQLATLMFIKNRINELKKKCVLRIICDSIPQLFIPEYVEYIKERGFEDIEVVLKFKYKTDFDLVKLYNVKRKVDLLCSNINLFVWYMPYSRMDRKIEGDIFTLKYVCEYINKMHFKKVYVVEPHSEVTIQLLDNVFDVYPVIDWLPAIKSKINFGENDHIVLPDKGAKLRYGVEHQNVCVLSKKREPITGRIETMELAQGKINKGSTCVIIDDLCSKGGTFELSAHILKSLGAKKVYLVVTHCEENIFNGELLKLDSPIDKIFTSKSILNTPHEKIEFMEIEVENYV